MTTACPVCHGKMRPFGSKWGKYIPQEFHFRRCVGCDFVMINNPVTDLSKVYDDAYYAGEGADPLVDYQFELEEPDQTVRRYEWRGIAEAVRAIRGNFDCVNWLDFGGGAGGLVRYLNHHIPGASAVAYDEGGMAEEARRRSIPFLTKAELAQSSSRFDIVTMIEVIEHLPDPVAELKQVRSYLKPGGLLFLTTGNAEPRLDRLLTWRYVTPEIHVSYFTPRNLALALEAAGFTPSFPGAVSGWSDIIRFKILKNLKVRKVGPFERVLPWPLLTKLADWRYGVSRHPVGWAA